MGALAFGAFLTYGRLHGIDLRTISTDSIAYKTATTVTYTSIVLSQFVNILSIRVGRDKSVVNRYIISNRRLLASFAFSLLLVAIIMYVPLVSQYFGF